MKAGQRIYWHGLFPNPKKVGTIKLTGTLCHEVQWDGSTHTNMEYARFLMSVAKFGKCCNYCKSLKEARGTRMTPRMAYYVDETMRTEHGYIPSVATEGQLGLRRMTGNGPNAQPWYWGKDIETAKRIAAEANASLGLSPDEVTEIVGAALGWDQGT